MLQVLPSFVSMLSIKNELIEGVYMQRKDFNQSAISPEVAQLQVLNRFFDFDWMNGETISRSKNNIKAVEATLKATLASEPNLSESEKTALGELCFKLGAFHNHVTREIGKAFDYLAIANQYLKGDAKAWVANHLAFTYQQQQFAFSKQNHASVKEYYIEALKQIDRVVTVHEGRTDESRAVDLEAMKIIAFARCVEASARYENGEHLAAMEGYRLSLALYEKHGLIDDQYARTKNRYAQMLAVDGQKVAANEAFKSLEAYWVDRNYSAANVYAARFYQAYAQYLEMAWPQHLELILEKYQKAHAACHAVEGRQSMVVKALFNKVIEIQKKLPIKNEAEISIANSTHTVFQREAGSSKTSSHESLVVKRGPA